MSLRMIDNQMDTFTLLENSYKNLKKENKSRRTTTIIDSYERTRNQFWTVIQNNHPTLMRANPPASYLEKYEKAVILNEKFIAKLEKFREAIPQQTSESQQRDEAGKSEKSDQPDDNVLTSDSEDEEDEGDNKDDTKAETPVKSADETFTLAGTEIPANQQETIQQASTSTAQPENQPINSQVQNTTPQQQTKQEAHKLNWADQVLEEEAKLESQRVRSNQNVPNPMNPPCYQPYMQMPNQPAPAQYVPYVGHQQFYYPYGPQIPLLNVQQPMISQPNTNNLTQQSAGGEFSCTYQIPQNNASTENTGHANPSVLQDASIISNAAESQVGATQPNQAPDFATAFTEFLRISNLQMKKSKLPSQKLSTFEGDLLEYTQWKEAFTKSVDGATNTEKMVHLLGYTKGEPKMLLSGLQVDDEAYDHAWERLDKKYNNKRTLLKNNINQALSKEIATKSKDSNSLLKWNSTLQTTVNNLKRLNATVDEIITEIFSISLDESTRLRMEDFLGAKLEPVKADEADNFVTKEIAVFQSKQREPSSNATSTSSNQMSDRTSPKRNKNKKSTQAMVAIDNSKTNDGIGIKCFHCSGPHLLSECEEFLRLDDKIESLIQKRVCIYCGKHKWKAQSPCKKRAYLRCIICQRDHDTLLHPKENTTAVTQGANDNMVLLPTAIAKIENSYTGLTEIRCLIDHASQSSYITSGAQKQLGLKKHKTRIIVKGINDSKQQMVTEFVYMKIHVDNAKFGKKVITVKAYVIPKIAGDLPMQTVKKPDWLDRVKLADRFYHISTGIEVLLGAEIAAEIILSGKPTLVREGLVLTPTVFGLVVSGKGQTDNHFDENIEVSTTYVTYMETMIKAMKDEQLNGQIAAFLELPEVYDPVDKENKIFEIEYCENLFREKTQRDDTGRYIVAVPVKPNGPKRGRSLGPCLKVVQITDIKGKRNPELFQKLKEFVQDYLTKGHMVETKDKKELFIERENDHYLSYLIVERKTSLTTKYRVVFNASLPTSNGVSLNDTIYEGENLLNDICDILTKCRVGQVIIWADVVQMFRQINLLKEYWSLFRILVRNEIDGHLIQYELSTVPFGTNASPWLAIRVLHQIAEDNTDDEEVKRAIKENFYMDDFVISLDSVEEAKSMISQVTDTLAKGQFPLSKWASNKEEALADVPEEKRLSYFQNEINENELKLLGLIYNKETDSFSINVKEFKEVKFSKRGLASFAAQLYDPLNFLLPYKIRLREIIQLLWIQKVDWDVEFDDKMKKIFHEVLEDHKNLKYIQIPRWIHANKDSPIELIGFCDASGKAKAAMVYVRVKTDEGYKVSLLKAKGNINKINTKAVVESRENTIPKNELESLTILASLLDTCAKIFADHKVSMRAYCDNKPAICWAKSVKPLKTKFHETRRKKIQNVLKPEEIFYVKSEENPADLASRGCSVTKLIENTLWWSGPLWITDEELPSDGVLVTEIPENCLLTKTEEDIKENILSHCNKYLQAIMTIGHILRWINYKRNPNTKIEKPLNYESYRPFTEDEFVRAKNTLIKYFQQLHFGDQIQRLKNNKPTSKHHWLHKLTPYLDKNGVLRVGGRLENAPISEDARHPIIIPNCQLADMIIEYVHLHDNLHLGESKILQSIIVVFHIPGVRTLIHRCVSKCFNCKRWKGKTIQPIMGQLPECRVSPAGLFERVGVDLCGPFSIKASMTRTNKTMKVWIASFICMSTKAIHLEIVAGLTTEFFLAAFNRFTSRRGSVKEIWSDNGTNLRGAARVLHLAWQDIFETSKNQLACKEIKWIFIPRKSPAMGGLWENSIKAFKTHLKRVTSTINLNFEELSTIVCKIEAIINSRALIANPIDRTEDLALTPFHFIAQRAYSVLPTEATSNPALPLSRRYRNLITLNNQFLETFMSIYIESLQKKSKWTIQKYNLRGGEIVVMKEDQVKPSWWKMGVVEKTYPDRSGVVRQALVRTKEGIKKQSMANLVILREESENIVSTIQESPLESAQLPNQQPEFDQCTPDNQQDADDDSQQATDDIVASRKPEPDHESQQATDGTVASRNPDTDHESQQATDDIVAHQKQDTDCESQQVTDEAVADKKQDTDRQSQEDTDENGIKANGKSSKPNKEKKIKGQDPVDFDPINPEPRRSARIRNKLTAKQVLMTWLAFLASAQAFEMLKLTPGIHIYKKNDISIKTTDWVVTSLSLFNVTEELSTIKNDVNMFAKDCEDKINVTTIQTYCTQLARQLKEKEKSTSELIHAIYSPRNRRYIGPILKGAWTLTKYAMYAGGAVLLVHETVEAFSDSQELANLQKKVSETQQRLQNATRQYLQLQQKTATELTEQLGTWQEKFQLKNVEQTLENSFIAISNVMTQMLQIHRRLVRHRPVELLEKEFARKAMDEDVEAPSDWEAALQYSVIEPVIIDEIAAVMFKIPLALKQKMSVYDVVSVADNTQQRPNIPTSKLGFTIAVNKDNTTYFVPDNELLIAPRFYEINELNPIEGCMKIAINPSKAESETCTQEMYSNDYTTVHKIDQQSIILQLAEKDDSTLMICNDSKLLVPPGAAYHLNITNCAIHNDKIPALYAYSMKSQINMDSLKPIEMSIPTRPSIDLTPFTFSPEWYEDMKEAQYRNENQHIYVPSPHVYIPSTAIIIILIVLALVYFRYIRKKSNNNQWFPQWSSPMVDVNVEVTQTPEDSSDNERPVVIVDSQNRVVRYDLKEARRRGLRKHETLAVPPKTEKY